MPGRAGLHHLVCYSGIGCWEILLHIGAIVKRFMHKNANISVFSIQTLQKRFDTAQNIQKTDSLQPVSRKSAFRGKHVLDPAILAHFQTHDRVLILFKQSKFLLLAHFLSNILGN